MHEARLGFTYFDKLKDLRPLVTYVRKYMVKFKKSYVSEIVLLFSQPIRML